MLQRARLESDLFESGILSLELCSRTLESGIKLALSLLPRHPRYCHDPLAIATTPLKRGSLPCPAMAGVGILISQHAIAGAAS